MSLICHFGPVESYSERHPKILHGDGRFMGSQRVFGNRRVEHEPDHSARLGRLGRVMPRLGDLRIRTRFFLGLGLLTLVAVSMALVGFQGLLGMNRLLVRTNEADRATGGR